MKECILSTYIAFFLLTSLSCSKNSHSPNPPSPCAGVNIIVSATTNPASPGQSNGTLTASASGSSNFSFSINGGSFQSSGAFTALAAGNYTVVAKNPDGCTGTSQFTVGTLDLCAGVVITVTAIVTNATGGGNNGSIVINTPSGAGFTFNINGGAFQASNSFTGLAAGIYTVIAKNSNGCTGTAQFTVTGIIPCSGITITGTTTTTTANPCVTPSNGSITVTASGGTGPYTYNINGGAFQSSNQFTGLSAGAFTIIIKDVNGCTGTLSVTVSATAPGALFNDVKQVLASHCALSGCHVGPNPQNGLDWTNNCMIVNNALRIKARAVDGNPSIMPPPPNPPLSAADKQKIVAWVNAGGQLNN